MIAITRGTTSWHATEALGPDEVEFIGAFLYEENGLTPAMVWDDAIQNVRARNTAEILAIEAAIVAEEQERAAQAKRDEVIKQAMNAFADAVLADKNITPTAALAAMKDAAAAKSIEVAVVEEEAVKP